MKPNPGSFVYQCNSQFREVCVKLVQSWAVCPLRRSFSIIFPKIFTNHHNPDVTTAFELWLNLLMQVFKFIYYLEFIPKVKKTKLCSLQVIKTFSLNEIVICKLGYEEIFSVFKLYLKLLEQLAISYLSI